ncbi:MAG: sulfate ABC transporter permease subunit CysT [Acidobacteria bacterium]|nr:sulfate ABC transporter permease subunit CysT [Acidobacteriota bacterium]
MYLPQPAADSRSLPWGRWGLRVSAVSYLGIMIVLPVSAILQSALRDGPAAFWTEITDPVAFAALKLTLGTAAAATLINAIMGTLTAYVLVRCEFRGRQLLNALVDMPFAMPTLVTGVMLVVLYGPQRALGALLESNGVKLIFAPPGIILALLLVTYPFVVRAVQPALMELETNQEEAALTIGAGRWVAFYRIVLPTIAPAIVTGSLLNFGRAIGEFGAIIVVAGNIPGRTLTAAVHVFGQIESQNQRGAAAMSILLLALSFALLLAVDWMQHRKKVPDVEV